jgi:hypothetical protein
VVAALAACSACADAPAADGDEGSSGPAKCGMTSCLDHVHVAVVAEGGLFAGGSYAIAWSLDGVDDDCGFTVATTAQACDGDPPCAQADDCDADFGLASQPQFFALDIVGAPELLELTVLRDNVVVLQTGFAPSYEDVHPNGEDCPPTCAQASASVDLP